MGGQGERDETIGWEGVRLASAFSAFIAVEWLCVYMFAAPPSYAVWIAAAAVLDIVLYWVVAHFVFENHEIEFSIGCILVPIMVGILIPVFVDAQRAAKRAAAARMRRTHRSVHTPLRASGAAKTPSSPPREIQIR